jgi:hypothetical protein
MTDIINFYENDDVKRLTPLYDNPNYNIETMPLKHPCRILLVAQTGGGKTNVCLNIIKGMNDTFKYIIIFTQNKEEPLYEFLEEKIPYPQLQIYEGISELKHFDFDDLDAEQTLIIFDDMCVESEKDQAKIKNLFIRGRKMCGMKGISLIYLTQSFFQTPSIIRKQMSHMILRKLVGKRDIDDILRQTSTGVNKDQLRNMYAYCCPENDITQFLLIDYTANESMRFRKGFSEILDADYFF